LTGLPTFNVAEVDRKSVEAALIQAANCKAAEVIPAFGHRAGGGEAEGDAVPREVIESEEIAKLVAETGRYEKHAAVLPTLIRAVLTAQGDEDLYAELLRYAGPILEEPHENP
jgi:hypothetical protein